MMVMPIAMLAMFAFFPAGLVLYYLTNTLLGGWRSSGTSIAGWVPELFFRSTRNGIARAVLHRRNG